jgi:hypothetical protein
MSMALSLTAISDIWGEKEVFGFSMSAKIVFLMSLVGVTIKLTRHAQQWL